MARKTLSDIQKIEASVALASGIEASTLEAFGRRNDQDDIEQIIDAAMSSEFQRQSTLSDLMAAIVEVADPSFSGPWKASTLINRCREIEAEIGYGLIGASAGTSTLSLSGVLSRLANKSLMMGYESVPQTLKSIAKRVPANNYKDHSSYQVTAGDLLDEVGPSGEIKSTALQEEQYTYRPAIFARQLMISEQDLVNDDLGALTAAGDLLGQQAAKRVELELASLITEAATVAGAQSSAGEFFFGSGTGANNMRPNYFEGASSALDIGSLGVAEAMMRAQVDRSGDPIDLLPTHLLSIGANHTVARNLYNSTEVRPVGSTAKTVATSNPYHQQYQPISSEWLRSSRLVSPAAESNWFLIHSSRRTAPMQIGFVGSDVPTVEINDRFWQQLAWSARCKLSFGCSLLDPRSIIKAKGSA